MKDWKEWFEINLGITNTVVDDEWKDPYPGSIDIQEMYQAFKGRLMSELIDEGYIEANPKKWVRPDSIDVYKYFDEKGVDRPEAECAIFYNYWESKDWYRGKTRIKNWKSAASTWIKNNEEYKRVNTRNNQEYDHSSTKWGKVI